MKLARRQFLHLMAGAVALPVAPPLAQAQTYPTRPVRIIVGQAAGSSSDITARLIAQWVSERLGQQFIVEVRPGAAGNIATEAVVNAPADGYTMLLVNAQNTINSSLYEKLNFDFLRDIAPVAGIDNVPLVMEVNPSFPAKTVSEFITYAKANPGKINMASAGIGGPQHVAGELFKFMAGVDLVHIPYRGSTPALTDLMAGQVQVMFDVTPSSLPLINSGKLRPLAVATKTRLDVLPNLPVLADFLPGYEANAWIGFGVPRNTPTGIIEALNKEFNGAISDPTIKKRLAELGAVAMVPNTPAEFTKHIADDTEKWAKVIKASGIKPE
ncbi:MAG TPA: tripartite tricarboxylate transporter substrate binding protein [Xanthobacteraceae bacterium]|nr:tripartite tricarboxylate transporter substrate binding protein [Xanthobacteraceae bacterium]